MPSGTSAVMAEPKNQKLPDPVPHRLTIRTDKDVADALHIEAMERGMEMSELADQIFREALSGTIDRVRAKRRRPSKD